MENTYIFANCIAPFLRAVRASERESGIAVDIAILKFLFAHAQNEDALHKCDNRQNRAKYSARQQCDEQTDDACRLFAHIEVVDSERAEEDGEQPCRAAAFARRPCREDVALLWCLITCRTPKLAVELAAAIRTFYFARCFVARNDVSALWTTIVVDHNFFLFKWSINHYARNSAC